MSKEFKHYQIRSTKKPAKNDLLSTTVAIKGADGKSYYCYINFSDKLVERVGKALPMGLMKGYPAYLFVSFEDYGMMHVYARTAKDSVTCLLWSSSIVDKGVPDWLTFYPVKVKENANS